MKKAVIFDLDGTLSDTIDSIAYFANNALGRVGLPPIEAAQYKMLVGNGARKLIERAVSQAGCTDKGILEQVLADYNKTYDDDFLYLTRVYDGIYPLIETLKSQGVALGVLSNKPHSTTIQVLDALFPEKPFNLYFGGREGVPLKPDPQAVLEIMDGLGLAAEDCLYVGDTAVDMQTGHAGGIFSVGVLWGFRGREELEQAQADAIIETPMELLKLL